MRRPRNPVTDGERFGRLVVVRKISENSKGYSSWLTVCDCGNEHICTAGNLRNGTTKSCGCLQKESRIKRGSSIRRVISKYKWGAKNRGYEFSLSDNEFVSVATKPCAYCGDAPIKISKSESGEEFLHNGIDRVNNDFGYTKNNVVSCCWKCNHLKGDMGGYEFLVLVERVFRHTTKNGVLVGVR